MENTIHIVGFGSQGSAWAECFRSSGWNAQIYLAREGKSFQKAQSLGFNPQSMQELLRSIESPNHAPHWIALLCPDSEVAPIYREWIASSPAEVRLILAHGYAVYARELQMQKPQHQITLLAPKAIGPKLLQNFKDFFPQPHTLVAGFSAAPESTSGLLKIAQGLGFAANRLVSTTLEKEAVGDLISEQGLLCGGIFNLLEWTLEAMAKADVPEALIREECLSELELIAGLIRERGPAQAFQAISQAAQAGTIAMRMQLEASGFKEKFQAQMRSVENREFVEFFRSPHWKTDAQRLTQNLSEWEKKLTDSPVRKEMS